MPALWDGEVRDFGSFGDGDVKVNRDGMYFLEAAGKGEMALDLIFIPLFARKWSIASRGFKRRPLVGRINVIPSIPRSPTKSRLGILIQKTRFLAIPEFLRLYRVIHFEAIMAFGTKEYFAMAAASLNSFSPRRGLNIPNICAKGP